MNEWMNEEAMRIGREDSSRKDPPNTVMLQWARAFPVEAWGASEAGGQRVLCAEDGKFLRRQLALAQMEYVFIPPWRALHVWSFKVSLYKLRERDETIKCKLW